MIQSILIVAGLVVLLIVILATLSRPSKTSKAGPVKRIIRYCPLCGEGLEQGQTVKSVFFPGSDKNSDVMVHIMGCPVCRPPAEGKRRCPVCKKNLSSSDTVFARQFKRRDQVRIHVLGCNHCRKKKS